MQTLPQIGLSKLAALRRRERLCHVVWGLVKWLSVAVACLAVSTLIDWWIDKYRETPMGVRVILTLVQAVGLAVAGWFWLVRPWAKGPSPIGLAHRVEEGIPEFDHRLITSIQLARKKDLGGMSPELIESLTRESEAIAGKHRFERFADHRLLKWAGGLVAVPLMLVAIMTAVYGLQLFSVLVQRQFLIAADIPRFNKIENLTAELWPAGDEVVVEYAVSGRVKEGAVGRLRVQPDDLPADEYKLEFVREQDDGRSVFAAKVPHSSVNFTHRAWVGDGRTRRASDVRFEPRPVVTRIDAWVQLPRFLGRRPKDEPYETYQSQGEITGLAGSTARVRVAVQKPVSQTQITLIARTKEGTGEIAKSTVSIQHPSRETTTPTGETEHVVEADFTLTSDLIAYAVAVWDGNGFANSTPPRRGIQIQPDSPPTVRLLPERYEEAGGNSSDEDIIEGLPVPIGGQIPIAYTCRSPQGVREAQLRYRVNEKGPWTTLKLITIEGDARWGPFDPNRGVFQQSPPGHQVYFHPLPSPDRDTQPDFLMGGGRFDFQTAEITKTDEDGKRAKLEIGDRIEFYVEVFDRNPDPNRPPGRSETRMKEVLTATEVLNRLDQTRQAEGKIRELEKKQRDVFRRPQQP